MVQRGAVMRYSTQIKPISYIKANAAQVLEQLAETQEPIIITQNGEAKAVIQDVRAYEKAEQALALLKILAMANEDIAAGRTHDFREVMAELRQRAVQK
jgi:prevent-host-death family protein